MRIGAPLLLIALVAYWFLNYRRPPTGSVRVVTSVRGAEILIGGIETGLATDTTLEIPTGRCIITVRKPSYRSEPEFVAMDVTRGSASRVFFTLRGVPRTVVTDTIAPLAPPSDVTFSTGEPIHSLPPAHPRVGRRLVDYTEESESASVSSRSPATPAAARAMAGIIGTQVTVTSTTEGAEVWVNGTATPHVTPYTFEGLASGLYAFRVRRDGYTSSPDSIVVSLTESYQRELAAFELRLADSSRQPALKVSTMPLAANIRLDGKAVGVGQANIETTLGMHRLEFADVPGYRTPPPIILRLTPACWQVDTVGRYERLEGRAYVAVLPSEEAGNLEWNKLRVYVDNELIVDSPVQRFDAALISRVVAGKRVVRVQYGDLADDLHVDAMDGQVCEVTFRLESFFSKRSLRLREKASVPFDAWQERARKLKVLNGN